jgi:acetolactate synthase I/III small subunit
MKHTLSVLVENQPGVLSRVSGLFSRRSFNIDSLAVGTTTDPGVSCITIVVDDKENAVEQIEKQLNKLVDVIKVKNFTPDSIISRELMLIKVNATSQTRREIKDLADIYGAHIADITRNSMTIECCNTTERLENLIDILRPYGLKQLIRTGSIALEKGNAQFSV